MFCGNQKIVKSDACGNVDLAFKNISYSVKNLFEGEKKQILKDVSGFLPSGNLIGILGPSGAGKSTLLNILSGFVTESVQGEIEINGKKRNLKSFKEYSCYITQENDLNELLTVQENMEYAADLKLGKTMIKYEKQKLIGGLLKSFGLGEVKDVRISRLSGGQQRRLAVVQELISNPQVIFLDEPTTGLDSYAGFRCIEYLKVLATQGRTIVCTIHQPTSTQFQLFDMVYFLSRGKCVYKGETDQIVPFLQNLGIPCGLYHSPADYVIELASGEYGEDKIELMIKESDNGNYLPSTYKTKKYSITDFDGSTENLQSCRAKCNFYEFIVLLRREFTKQKRHRSATYIRILASIFIASSIGLVYFKLGEKASLIWFNYNFILAMNAAIVLTSAMLTISSFPMEFQVVKKEHFNGYFTLNNYFAVVTIIDVPLAILCTTLHCTLGYLLTYQPLEANRFFMFLFIGLLESVTAQSFGLLLGAVFQLRVAIVLAVFIHIPILLFSGFGMMFIDIPRYFYWLTYLAYVGYTVTAQAGAIFGYNRDRLACEGDFCLYTYGRKFLDTIGIDGEHFWYSCLIMLAYYLVFRVSAYFIMKRKLNN